MDKKQKILVVDDISLNLSNVEQALKGRYEVIPVNSGARAIKYIAKQKPDLILLDIRMENLDGIQTLKEIRTMQNGADVPVIMLTAKRDKNTVLESAALGIIDYIVKPFVPKDLLTRVRNALDALEKATEEKLTDEEIMLNKGKLHDCYETVEEL